MWSEVQPSHLCFLQRCHATAQHGATVATDLQKDFSVVATGTGSDLVGLQYCRQSGPVDDQTEVEAVYWQPGITYDRLINRELLIPSIIDQSDVVILYRFNQISSASIICDHVIRGSTAFTMQIGVKIVKLQWWIVNSDIVHIFFYSIFSYFSYYFLFFINLSWFFAILTFYF